MTATAAPESQEEVLAPVVYELGKALFIAQQFETCLLFLVALLNHHGGEVNKDSFLEGLGNHTERTLGQLAKAFREKLELPENFLSFIRDGVEVRNSIAHGFVLRNSTRLRTGAGRAELIVELQDAQYRLEQRRLFAEKALDRCLNVFGGSLEQLQSEAESKVYSDLLSHVTRH